MELIAQGAEAKIYTEGGAIVKDRIVKSYRIPQLDDLLRKSRTKREATILVKVPGIAPHLLRTEDTRLVMEQIEGRLVKEVLDKDVHVAKDIGRLLAKLHQKNIMHADLTTSNMFLTENGQIKFIDFGLSFISHRVEDMAVDLHLFRQALESKHVKVWESAFNLFLEGYKEGYPGSKEVLERFAIVESRGRNKQSY